MSGDLVKRICQMWIDNGMADDCFWEDWHGCPSPEDSLTPRMVLDRIEELEAKLAKAALALESAQESISTFIGVHGYPRDSGAWLVLAEVSATIAELKD